MPNTKELQEIVHKTWKGLFLPVTGALAPEGALLEADHLEWYLGEVRRARKFNLFSASSLTGIPLHIIAYQLADGSYQLIVITSEKVYSYASASVGFVDEGNYSGASTRRVFSDTFAGELIFTDNTNFIQKWDGTTLAALPGIGNVYAESCASFWAHFLLFHTTEAGVENPFRVRWSTIGNSGLWSGGTSGFVDLLDGKGTVRCAAPLGNRLITYKDEVIYECAWVGTPIYFDFNPVSTRTGIRAPKTLAIGEGFHFFLGPDNVYAFDGRQAVPIGEPIAEELFGPRAITASDNIAHAFGSYIERLREYWLAIPTGVSSQPNKVYRYSLPSQSWWPRSSSVYYRAIGDWFDSDALIWLDLVGTWNDFGASETWSELGGVGQLVKIPLVGVANGTNGDIYYIDESEPSTAIAYYVTRDYIFDILTRILEYRVECKGPAGTVTVSYSTDEGGTWTSLGAKNVESGWSWLSWTLNDTVEVVRFKVELSDSDIKARKRTVLGIEKRR
ncbi:MAG: hypothetical protein ACWGQW_00970 [bacterium]